MKMKKNDRLELIRQGGSAIRARLVELESELKRASLDRRKQAKNVREGWATRRTIAQLKTALFLVKETK